MTGSINAIGYNLIDNVLYGIQNSGSPQRVLKIGAQGQQVEILNMPVTTGVTSWNVADVDETGTYWVSSGGTRWVQINLNTTTVVNTGTAATTFGSIFDWAYVPGGGDFLYSISSDAAGNGFLQRFSRQTKTWSQVGTGYGAIYPRQATVGAVYAGSDGVLYAADNTSGRIHRFLLDGRTSTLLRTGPTASGNDGAHCILNST